MDTRTITHADHTDTETLFGEVWAVTICNCNLRTQEYYINMEEIIKDLCRINPNGWTMEDAIIYHDCFYIQNVSTADGFVRYIRHEATSTDGILRETNGNYTLRSK